MSKKKDIKEGSVVKTVKVFDRVPVGSEGKVVGISKSNSLFGDPQFRVEFKGVTTTRVVFMGPGDIELV